MKFKWYMPTEVFFGTGKLERLPEITDKLSASRPLLVIGSGAMAGAADRVKKLLSCSDLAVHQGVNVNLPLEDVDKIISSARKHDADAVIGMGGGSVMDGAKAAALMSGGSAGVRDHLAGKKLPRPLPFVSIPTTSGTGSEVTPFMIFMDVDARKKLSFGPPQAFAKATIVDPDLTLSLPKDQTAATGLDALSHCLESYWSKLATPPADALALQGISAVFDNLEKAYNNPHDRQARAGMAYAAMIAGMALAQTATAAVHGLTYPMTAHHGVAHGFACAFVMRDVMKINFHHLSREKQDRLLKAMRSNTIGAALDYMTDVMKNVGAPETLNELGIPASAIDTYIREATPKNLDRNIAPLEAERIREIWKGKIK